MASSKYRLKKNLVIDQRAEYVGRHTGKSKSKLLLALLRAENETEKSVIIQILDAPHHSNAATAERIPARSAGIKARRL